MAELNEIEQVVRTRLRSLRNTLGLSLDELAARGHRFQKIGRKGEVRYGYAAALVVDPDNRTVQGGAEPSRSHAAVAVPGTTNPAGR